MIAPTTLKLNPGQKLRTLGGLDFQFYWRDNFYVRGQVTKSHIFSHFCPLRDSLRSTSLLIIHYFAYKSPQQTHTTNKVCTYTPCVPLSNQHSQSSPIAQQLTQPNTFYFNHNHLYHLVYLVLLDRALKIILKTTQHIHNFTRAIISKTMNKREVGGEKEGHSEQKRPTLRPAHLN